MPCDDTELEIEPLAIFVDRVARRQTGGFETPLRALPPRAGAVRSLHRRVAFIVGRETRQNRLVRARPERAALCDLDGVSQRLRQIAQTARPSRRGS